MWTARSQVEGWAGPPAAGEASEMGDADALPSPPERRVLGSGPCARPAGRWPVQPGRENWAAAMRRELTEAARLCNGQGGETKVIPADVGRGHARRRKRLGGG